MLGLRTLTTSATIAALGCVLVSSASAAATAKPCTPAEANKVAAAIEPMQELLNTCIRDTGFTLYPFTMLPTYEQQRSVCNGRSCPGVTSTLQKAKLPTCTITIQGETMTIDEYLAALCTVRSVPAADA